MSRNSYRYKESEGPINVRSRRHQLQQSLGRRLYAG